MCDQIGEAIDVLSQESFGKGNIMSKISSIVYVKVLTSIFVF